MVSLHELPPYEVRRGMMTRMVSRGIGKLGWVRGPCPKFLTLWNTVLVYASRKMMAIRL